MVDHTSTTAPETLDRWIGLDVYGVSGEEIGEISDIYIDDVTNRPQWMTITSGWFGMNSHFAPIEGAEYRSGNIHIPFAKETVKDAPSLDADDDHLEPGEETRLFTHYEHAVVNSGAAGRAGLRKYVVTEDIDLTVPVRNERAAVDGDVNTTK